MENRSFEGDSTSGSPPNDPKDNPPGPSKPRADPSGESKDQAKERIAPLAWITDDEDESPPAYVRRYMPQEKKTDDVEDLEPPPPEPVQEPRDVRLDPEFQQQASRRRARRHMQNLVEGPCSLRPDPPNRPPLPAPEPYPDPDLQLQPAGAPVPGQEVAGAPVPGQEVAGAPVPGQEVAGAPVPGQEVAGAPVPGQEVAGAPVPGQEVAGAPVPGEQVVPAYLAAWQRCASCYKRIRGFSFQFPFQTLLLTWPLSTTIMGVLNSNVCFKRTYLPYVMIGVGLLGTITILLRIFVMYYKKLFVSARTKNFWIGIRTTEFLLWIVFTIQLYIFFEHAPSFTPGKEHYCKPRFYKINCGLMFLSSATMIGWIVVNVGNFIYWFPRRNQRPSP